MFDSFIPELYLGVTRAQFLTRARSTATAIGIPVEWLLSVMLVESGLKPNARYSYNGNFVNPKSGKYYTAGLIQWVNSTSVSLHGLTTNEIHLMDGLKQLDLSYQYFKKNGFVNKLQSLDDVFMAVHYPAYVGKPAGTTLYASGSEAYKLNKTIDTDTTKGGNNDGKVTYGELSARYRWFVKQKLGPANYAKIPESLSSINAEGKKWVWVGVGAAAIIAIILYFKAHEN